MTTSESGAEGRRVEIRAGRREDARAAARLWMQSARDHAAYDPVYQTTQEAENMMRNFLADLSSSGHSFLFIAEIQSHPDETPEVVGFVSGELREGSPTFSPRTWASVDDVFVLEEVRSLGIGRSLMEQVSAWATGLGADGVSLQVAVANERGRKFYRDLGFREVSIYQVLDL